MRHGRTIIIRHPTLRRLRNNLRFIFRAYFLKGERESLKLSPSMGKKKIAELTELELKLSKSIYQCPGCSAMFKDMTYSAREKRWYCTECFLLYYLDNLPLSKPQLRTFLDRLAGPEGCQYDGRE